MARTSLAVRGESERGGAAMAQGVVTGLPYSPGNPGSIEQNFLPRSYLGCMRCFLGSGQKAMQAMLSISRTYENTADYKIQTHSERPFPSTVQALSRRQTF